VKKRLDEELSVGAIAGVDPTGATDSTAALNGFFSLLNTNGTRTTIRIPAGTYLTTGLTINNTSLVIKGAGDYPYGASTTKIKAATANTTLMTFTGSGCRVEGLLFEGFEATVTFGAGETCTGLKFQPSTGTLADIDSTVLGCTFFGLKNGVIGYGRNLTQRLNGYSHVAFPITLNYVSGQQFRGHVIDENRFHSCGGLGASTDASLAGSVCIKLVVNTAAGTLADNYAGNISIRNNKCDGGCYQFFSGSLHRGSIFSNNDMFRCGGAGATVVKIDNTQTVSNTDYEAVVFSGNVLASDIPVSTPQAFPDYALWMTGIRGAVLSGNDFSKVGKHGIVIDNCADLIISSTQLKNPNMNVAVNGATFNAVEITNGGNNIQILGLNVRCTQANPQIQYVVNNASAQNVMVENVQAGNYTGMYNEGASARTHGTLNFGANRRKEVFATATSTLTSGNYAVGDICWLTAPAATGTSYIGAVCVTAGIGSAAVWRSFGALV
ncbi:TPA: glycosyl hydrolase family 28-related protein, partial [Enterobacter cloacae]